MPKCEYRRPCGGDPPRSQALPGNALPSRRCQVDPDPALKLIREAEPRCMWVPRQSLGTRSVTGENKTAWPIRRTSGAGTGIKDGPRRIPAYQGWTSAGKKFFGANDGLLKFRHAGSNDRVAGLFPADHRRENAGAVGLPCSTTPAKRESARLERQLLENVAHASDESNGLAAFSLKRHGSTPGTIRTCDLRIRNPLLYPTELRGRVCPV